MNRPYIIFTLVALVSIHTAARNYFNNSRIRNSRIPCETTDVEFGECVPYDQCRRYSSVYPNVNNFTETRTQDGPCSSLEVCCMIFEVIHNPTGSEPIPRGGYCGWRNPKSIRYHSTGDSSLLAKFGEFPWMVSVLKATVHSAIREVSGATRMVTTQRSGPHHRKTQKDENDPSSYKSLYLGGGSLIHPSVVLTAAHILRGESLMVRAGEWETQTKVYPHQEKNVWKVVIHKDFNEGNLLYDVALLFLETSMRMAPNVGTVCLPPAGLRAAVGTKCFASGWGMNNLRENGQYQTIMKKVELPVIDRNVCQNNLRNNSHLSRYFELHSTFMCTGGEPSIESCVGGGGTPLVCPIDFETDRFMQSGIVSWGLGCGQNGSPGVHVDVAELREWIDSEFVKQGLSTDFYTFE